MFAGLVMILESGTYFQQFFQGPNMPACNSLICGIAVLIGLAGYILGFVGLSGAIKSLFREGYITRKDSRARPQIGSGPDEERILGIANELARGLRLRAKLPLVAVAWSDSVPWYECQYPGPILKKPATLSLSSNLRGKLGPEVWKTLLSYYLIKNKPRPQDLVKIIFMLGWPVLLWVALVVGISSVYGRQVTGLYLQVGGTPFFLIILVRMFPTVKKWMLNLDTWAAKSLGERNLLDLFERIDKLQLPEIENSKRREGWVRWQWPMPNITERIRNIQAGMSRVKTSA